MEQQPQHPPLLELELLPQLHAVAALPPGPAVPAAAAAAALPGYPLLRPMLPLVPAAAAPAAVTRPLPSVPLPQYLQALWLRQQKEPHLEHQHPCKEHQRHQTLALTLALPVNPGVQRAPAAAAAAEALPSAAPLLLLLLGRR